MKLYWLSPFIGIMAGYIIGAIWPNKWPDWIGMSLAVGIMVVWLMVTWEW